MVAARGPRLSGLQVRCRREHQRSGCHGWSGAAKHWTGTASRPPPPPLPPPATTAGAARASTAPCRPSPGCPAAPGAQPVPRRPAGVAGQGAAGRRVDSSICPPGDRQVGRVGGSGGHCQCWGSSLCCTRLLPLQYAHGLKLLAPGVAALLQPHPGPMWGRMQLLTPACSTARLPARACLCVCSCPCTRRYRSVDRKDIQLIEHLIRKGRRQLELFQTAEVTAVRLQGAPGGSGSGSSSAAARGASG